MVVVIFVYFLIFVCMVVGSCGFVGIWDDVRVGVKVFCVYVSIEVSFCGWEFVNIC